jgi:hypothetical protein
MIDTLEYYADDHSDHRIWIMYRSSVQGLRLECSIVTRNVLRTP